MKSDTGPFAVSESPCPDTIRYGTTATWKDDEEDERGRGWYIEYEVIPHDPVECFSCRRSSKKSGDAKVSVGKATTWRIWKRDGFACKKCGVQENLTIDHIYPRSLGGTSEDENLQTLCGSCNSRKGAKV